MMIWSRPDLYFDLERLLGVLLRHVAAESIPQSHRVLSRVCPAQARQLHSPDVLQHEEPHSPRVPSARSDGGLPADEPDRLGPIRIDDQDRNEVAAKLAEFGADARGYLVVNPNASDLMIERRWPLERFAVMIDRLVEQHGLPVVLIVVPGRSIARGHGG